MPVFEPTRDTSDPAGEAILARVLFGTAEAHEAAIARGRRMAEGENPFLVSPTSRVAAHPCGIPPGPVEGTLTTFAA